MNFDVYPVTTPLKEGVEYIGNIPEKPKFGFFKTKFGFEFSFWKKSYPTSGRPFISALIEPNGNIKLTKTVNEVSINVNLDQLIQMFDQISTLLLEKAKFDKEREERNDEPKSKPHSEAKPETKSEAKAQT